MFLLPAPSFVASPNVTSINSSAVRVSWSNNNSRLNGAVTSCAVCFAIGHNESEPWKVGPMTMVD